MKMNTINFSDVVIEDRLCVLGLGLEGPGLGLGLGLRILALTTASQV